MFSNLKNKMKNVGGKIDSLKNKASIAALSTSLALGGTGVPVFAAGGSGKFCPFYRRYDCKYFPTDRCFLCNCWCF